ncbi:MAG: hypothetical protein RL264_2810 [Bacteroidota bacterium]|jgi:hypothetical protein
MKKITLLSTLCFLFLTLVVKAQTPPNAFNYSAVARNAAGQPIATATIGIQVTILKTSPTGASQYSENHFVNTDAFGLFNLVIGAGAVQSGSMATIDWSNDNYYLKVGMDATGGTNFLTMGTTQLLSVPYAMYAKSAGSVSGGANETDPVFGASVASGITGADTTNWNNKQNQLVAGSNITITGNTISATTSGGGGFTHYIGEAFGGGVIFHLWKDNAGVEHGLIVDKTDLSTAQVWSNIDQTLIGPAAQSSWDGLSNSNATVGQAGHTSSAAALCLNSTNGGQSDWYLPSIDELSLLWHSRFNVNKSLSTIGGATVLPNSAYYWSSTENGFNYAWSFNFPNGNASNDYKYFTYYVRAVRAF